MFDHPNPWVLGIVIGVLSAVVAAIAARLRILPEVLDVSLILTMAGTVGLLFALYGAERRVDGDRLAPHRAVRQPAGVRRRSGDPCRRPRRGGSLVSVMLRALAPYLLVALAINVAAGAAYGAGLIGVALVYASALAACLVELLGYVRWDERHHA